MLALVFLGVPGVIYAVSFGALTQEQGWLIGIGLALVLVLVLLYAAFLAVARMISRRAAQRAIERDLDPEQSLLSARRLAVISQLTALLAAGISTALAGSTAFDILRLFDAP